MVSSTPYTPGDPFASPGFAMAYSAQRQQMYMMTPVPGQHTAGHQGAPVTPLKFNHPDLSGCPQPLLVPVTVDAAHHNVAPATPGAPARTQHPICVLCVVCSVCRVSANCPTCPDELHRSPLSCILRGRLPDYVVRCLSCGDVLSVLPVLCFLFCAMPCRAVRCCPCWVDLLHLLVGSARPTSSEISPAGLISPSPPAKEQREKQAATQTPQHPPKMPKQHIAELRSDTPNTREPLKPARQPTVT